ncbi:hypothetical protein HAX54_004365, partial [Datura stramonium]|nr:hypothetical protein [Datura stramonium]
LTDRGLKGLFILLIMEMGLRKNVCKDLSTAKLTDRLSVDDPSCEPWKVLRGMGTGKT